MLVSIPTLAGDAAQLRVLGWSSDMSKIGVLQSGVANKSGLSYAGLRLLDVASGNTIKDGKFEASPSSQSSDDAAALLKVLDASSALRKKLGVDGSRPGTVAFDSADGASDVVVRTPIGPVKVRLVVIRTLGPDGSPTAHYNVELIGPAGAKPVGGDWNAGQDAMDYTVRFVRLAPDEKSLLVVLAAAMPGVGGPSLRYVPLAARLPSK